MGFAFWWLLEKSSQIIKFLFALALMDGLLSKRKMNREETKVMAIDRAGGERAPAQSLEAGGGVSGGVCGARVRSMGALWP